MWFEKLEKELNELGLCRTAVDPCLFIGRSGSKGVWLLVYVNDILIAAASEAATPALMTHLAAVIDLREDGDVGSYLGVSIERNRAKRSLWRTRAAS